MFIIFLFELILAFYFLVFACFFWKTNHCATPPKLRYFIYLSILLLIFELFVNFSAVGLSFEELINIQKLQIWYANLVRQRNKFPFLLKNCLYRKDTEHLYHAFVYSLIILLSSIYPFMQCLSLLVTIICYPYI